MDGEGYSSTAVSMSERRLVGVGEPGFPIRGGRGEVSSRAEYLAVAGYNSVGGKLGMDMMF